MTLRENEKLISSVRRDKASLNSVWALCVGLLFLFFFVLFYLKFNFFGYTWQVFAGLALVLFAAVLYKLQMWRSNVLFITNQRIIRNEQKGLFHKTVTEILYRDIHEIIFSKKGFASVMNNYGSLIIRTPSNNKIVFEKIPDPEKVVEIINKTRISHEPAQL